MINTEIRHYEKSDEEEVVNLWNKSCVFDAIDIKRFRRNVILDENFDRKLSWVAVDDNKIVGFIYGTKRKFPYLERGLEPERGWINIIFVDNEYCKNGIGTALLKRCEETLFKLGCTNITLGAYSPYYFFPGIDIKNYIAAVKFFEKSGYVKQEKHYSMGKNLHGYHIPQSTAIKQRDAEEKGYRFVRFSYEYTIELLEFLQKEFGGGWKRNALIAMQNGQAEDSILLAINNENRICGFCMRAIDGNPMRFGPIGIAKGERSLGIGGILLDLQCLEMCKKGIYRMYFITTDELGKTFYEKHGLQVFRTFEGYVKYK